VIVSSAARVCGRVSFAACVRSLSCARARHVVCAACAPVLRPGRVGVFLEREYFVFGSKRLPDRRASPHRTPERACVRSRSCARARHVVCAARRAPRAALPLVHVPLAQPSHRPVDAHSHLRVTEGRGAHRAVRAVVFQSMLYGGWCVRCSGCWRTARSEGAEKRRGGGRVGAAGRRGRRGRHAGARAHRRRGGGGRRGALAQPLGCARPPCWCAFRRRRRLRVRRRSASVWRRARGRCRPVRRSSRPAGASSTVYRLSSMVYGLTCVTRPMRGRWVFRSPPRDPPLGASPRCRRIADEEHEHHPPP
jgi:hypothetical protein